MTEPKRAAPSAAEEAWLEREIAEADFLCNTGRASIYRRILQRLRAAPVVPDREALGRALYIYAGRVSQEGARTAHWESQSDVAAENREFWKREADRLVRILGGFPAVSEQQASGIPWEIFDYVASFAHIGLHGLKEARTWQECDRYPCKVAARVSPPTPAVEQEPRAWECPACGLVYPWRWSTCEGETFGHLPVRREKGTPLYAGPPVDHSQEG